MRRRGSLFNGWWRDADGQALRRATQAELREANRLWWRHKDLRQPRKKYARVIFVDDGEAAA